ncbi:MAG: glycosyltransferase [Anaerolineae bacterium]|nr:glycosyltransferase [Anaerolineae bacterium]MDW8101489.1 glycosyltransferase [Anaerolineae bacterium]
MRILHVYKDYFPVTGGIENHIRLLAREQARSGHDVTVLVTNLKPKTVEELREGVRVIKAARLAHVASTPLSISFFRLMGKIPAQVVHLHFPYPPGEVANFLRGRGKISVLTYHSDVVRQRFILALYYPLLLRILSRIDGIIVTSPRYLDSSPFLQLFREKCAVIPLGVEVERFASASEEEVSAIRHRYGHPLILFVGKLRYYKGIPYLLEAMRNLEARLLIVGSGPMGKAWKKLSSEMGLDGKVFFLGEVEDEKLPAFYHACDLFVLPASHRSEAFGTVLIEAMAAGKPVISTELGTGTSWINRDGETGLVVPPRDPEALARAVKFLLENEPLRFQMGEKARLYARSFSVEEMTRKVLDFYQELLEGKRR